ncbi:MAG: hypothetical protein U0263_20710 [Polyangiaceae bacterium]
MAGPVASAAPDCGTLFAPPAGAVPLCDEHNLGNGAEIHWRSFAIGEAFAAVSERYRKLGAACGAEVKAEDHELSLGKGEERLSVHPSTPRTYPSCAGQAPLADQPTVVVVSVLFRR